MCVHVWYVHLPEWVYVGSCRSQSQHHLYLPQSLSTLWFETGHLSNPGVWQFSKELPSKFHGSTDFYLPRAGHAAINPTFYLFPLLLCVWCVYVNVAYMLQYTNGSHRTTFQSWFCPSVLVLRQVFSYLWHAKYFRLADWWVSGLFFHDCLPPPCWTTELHHHIRLFMWAQGTELWSSGMSGRVPLCTVTLVTSYAQLLTWVSGIQSHVLVLAWQRLTD